jgi:deazaflavin-dependent oxidoreductase (nitroreductase family)
MNPVAAKIAKVATGTHTAIYRASKGKVAGSMNGQKLVLLTTTGRRSGKRRTSPLMAFDFRGDLVLVASAGGSDRHPAWYHNIKGHPQVTVDDHGTVRTMTARTMTAAERAEMWPQVVAQQKRFGGYESKTSREIPLVVLTAA